MTKTEKEIKDLVLPIVEELGYQLYDVEFVKESSERFLRLYIEKDNHTIDLDDCEKVSDAVGEKLDEVDPIGSAYHLEVSSCGLERHLREPEHFVWAVGKRISVKLYKALNSQKKYDGELEAFENDRLRIKINEKEEIEIKLEEISSAKILYNWEDLENE